MGDVEINREGFPDFSSDSLPCCHIRPSPSLFRLEYVCLSVPPSTYVCIFCFKVRGYGATGDAHHVAAPTEDGDGPTRAMLSAIGSCVQNLQICIVAEFRGSFLRPLKNVL